MSSSATAAGTPASGTTAAESALPQLPVAGPRRVDRGPHRRPARLRVLSRRLHRAPGASPTSPLQNKARGLRHPLPRDRRHPAHHRRRSPPSRGRDRLLRRAAHLGTDLDASSASALCRPRRRPLARWHAVDRVSTGLLPPGPRPVSALPSALPRRAAGGLRRRAAPLRRLAPRPRRSAGALPRISSPRGRPSGSSMPNGPSPVRSRSSTTSAATRTAWPSPTTGCSTSTTATCASATRTTAPPPRRRRRR